VRKRQNNHKFNRVVLGLLCIGCLGAGARLYGLSESGILDSGLVANGRSVESIEEQSDSAMIFGGAGVAMGVVWILFFRSRDVHDASFPWLKAKPPAV